MLSPKELRNAEEFWIRKAQEEVFKQELDHLKENKPVLKSSRMMRLNPAVDSRGLIRMMGRIDAAKNLETDTAQPIILPRKHRVTWLLIDQTHDDLYHKGGVNHILHRMSQRYWIIGAREAIKSVKYNCALCLKLNALTRKQIMAP